MTDMPFTLETYHLGRLPLNPIAPENMLCMSVPFHFERALLNAVASENMQYMSVTRDTSWFEMPLLK